MREPSTVSVPTRERAREESGRRCERGAPTLRLGARQAPDPGSKQLGIPPLPRGAEAGDVRLVSSRLASSRLARSRPRLAFCGTDADRVAPTMGRGVRKDHAKGKVYGAGKARDRTRAEKPKVRRSRALFLFTRRSSQTADVPTWAYGTDSSSRTQSWRKKSSARS